MSSILEDYNDRRSLLTQMNYQEIDTRISGFNEWLEATSETMKIIVDLENKVSIELLLAKSKGKAYPPQASTPEEVVRVGLYIMHECECGEKFFALITKLRIKPPYNTNSIQDICQEALNRYVEPALDFIGRRLEQDFTPEPAPSPFLELSLQYPPEIHQSRIKFISDYPNPARAAFVMMRFGNTPAHEAIENAIQSALEKYGITALRADQKEYHDDLFPNVLTYIYGCHFGIAVFERLEKEEFNPNVALEVGYMRALRKPICLLKDKTLTALQTDLVGKLYREFDPQNPAGTIPNELDSWLRDKDIITA